MRRGLSLIELLLGMFILFLTTSFMCGVLISSSDGSRRSRERSMCTLLARSQLESLHFHPAPEIPVANGNFPGTLKDYSYRTTLTPVAPELELLSVEVDGPSLVASTARTYVRNVAQAGVVPFDGTHFLVTLHGLMTSWTAGSGATVPAGTAGAVTSAICGTGPLTWMTDSAKKAIAQVQNPQTTPTEGTLRMPIGMGLPGGIGASDDGNTITISDRSNHCIWDLVSNINDWKGPFFPMWPQAPLGEPGPLASWGVPGGTSSWFADITNNCLRMFSETTDGFDPKEYRPPQPLSHPRGVAVEDSGVGVYVVDDKNLWRYDTGALSWKSVALPMNLVADVPAALGWCKANSKLYILDNSGAIWQTDQTLTAPVVVP
ncbi:MAG: NHL repeat-containing protein [Candidatus Xenobia bacterium]